MEFLYTGQLAAYRAFLFQCLLSLSAVAATAQMGTLYGGDCGLTRCCLSHYIADPCDLVSGPGPDRSCVRTNPFPNRVHSSYEHYVSSRTSQVQPRTQQTRYVIGAFSSPAISREQ